MIPRNTVLGDFMGIVLTATFLRVRRNGWDITRST